MEIDEKLAELIGITIGDGCISITKRYSEYAVSGDVNEEREYYDSHVIPLMKEVLARKIPDVKICGKEYSKTGVYGVYIFDKRVTDFFIEYGLKSGKKTFVEIPKSILENKKTHIPFLRGLFDTDGSIFFQKSNSTKNPIHKFPRITLVSTSHLLIEQVANILLSLGYSPKIQKPSKGKRDKNPSHRLSIHRRQDTAKWIEETGFSSPKHLTKIAVWRKLGYCPPKTTINQRKAILNG
ncbi:hypothetical protein JXB27_04090 [Candidatus Woesearchaeota archaeon]|nr:hypothetical protein [Candidatus Woesearchaeota archaeon]